MLQFPSQLAANKGGVAPLLCAVGGLLMTVTAGGCCVDVAVSAAQDPVNLKRLSNALLGLMGLGFHGRADVKAKHGVNFLFFTERYTDARITSRLVLASAGRVFETTPLGTRDFPALRRFPAEGWSSLKCLSSRRIYDVFFCGVRSRPVLTPCVGDRRSGLKTCRLAGRLRWPIDFSSKAPARGDAIFLSLAGPTGLTGAGSAPEEPRSRTLGLSALCALFLWMLRPYVALCAAICLGWTVLQRLHRALQKRSE